MLLYGLTMTEHFFLCLAKLRRRKTFGDNNSDEILDTIFVHSKIILEFLGLSKKYFGNFGDPKNIFGTLGHP